MSSDDFDPRLLEELEARFEERMRGEEGSLASTRDRLGGSWSEFKAILEVDDWFEAAFEPEPGPPADCKRAGGYATLSASPVEVPNKNPSSPTST